MFTMFFFPLGLWGLGVGVVASQTNFAPPPPPSSHAIVAMPAYADTLSFEDAPRISDTTFPTVAGINTSMPEGWAFHWPQDWIPP